MQRELTPNSSHSARLRLYSLIFNLLLSAASIVLTRSSILAACAFCVGVRLTPGGGSRTLHDAALNGAHTRI